MSEVLKLFEQLKQCDDTYEAGNVNLNDLYTQQSSLLHNILCMLERLEAEREAADVRKADVGESQLDEKSSSHIDQQKAAQEQLSSGTEMPSLSTSDTSGQVEDSEEGVSKSLMQDLVKENQEVKKEVETLKNQFSQCVTLEQVQVLLSQRGLLLSVSEGALNQLAVQTQSQQSSLLHTIFCMLERLCAERETADGRKADVGRDVGESQPDEKSSSHIDQQKAAQEQLSSGTEMLSLSTSVTSGQVEDSEEGVFKSLMQDLVKENQERKKEVEALKNQFSQCVTLEQVQDLLSPLVSVSDGALHQSQDSSEVEQVPETLEALADVGELQEKHESLEARVECLEGERDDILDQLNQLKTQLVDAVTVDRKKVYEVEPLDMGPVNVSESSGLAEELAKSEATLSQIRDSFSGLEQQLHLQTADIRNAVQKLEEEVQNMKQELLALRLEQKRSPDSEMQDKLDSLQSKLDSVMASTASMLSSSLPQEDLDSTAGQEGAAEPEWLSGMADLSMKISELFQQVENLQSIITDLKKQENTDTTSELTSDVQGAVLQLQAEFEKLRGTTTQLMKDHTQEQSHIEHLYKTMKELDEKKADKKAVKIVKSIKADMQALDTKVLQCDTKTVMLNRTFQDLLTGHEDHCHQVTEKIFRELDCKLNHTELDLLKKQLELDCQMRIHKELQQQRAPESDDAAGLKKQLTNFNCLSCDRCVEINTTGPRLRVLPELPSLPAPKGHRRLRTYTNLDQYEQSPTEWSMEQTMIFRVSDGCGFDGHIYNTSEVRVPTISPKKGYCKNKEMVNRSQLLTPSGRKSSRLLPLRPQQPETQLICYGSNCLEKGKQWFIEDSIPQTLQCRQPRKPVGNNN
ncbi:glutamine-rich protein 2-like isoform X2 [Ictalurus furcatus]|uniref:glutamine-rich protein 2-like isoform X2 n=1 Tax=Ictalurus furcatus TaxID=66913 RepID=UPI00234FB811|nr:glutamine-rich protein 2-like isoform X2 [Ictalurus furcatus]